MVPELLVGFVVLAWMATVAVPMPSSDLTRKAVIFAVLGVLFTAVTVVVARYALPFRSWADLGVRWPGTFLLVAGATAYVAVMQVSAMVNSQLMDAIGATSGDYPGSRAVDPGRIPGDLASAIHTSFAEEIVMFAVPISCGALALRRWGSRQWARLLILSAVVIVVVGVRYLGHSWNGAGAVRVIPWMLGAWLIYRWCRSVWPLVFGHIVYDACVMIGARLPDQRWPSIVFYGLIVAGVLLLPVVQRHAARRYGAVGVGT